MAVVATMGDTAISVKVTAVMSGVTTLMMDGRMVAMVGGAEIDGLSKLELLFSFCTENNTSDVYLSFFLNTFLEEIQGLTVFSE